VDLFPDWVVSGFLETSSSMGLESMDYLWGGSYSKKGGQEPKKENC
jgi:hypothetical protein